jgi:hypothetical protein
VAKADKIYRGRDQTTLSFKEEKGKPRDRSAINITNQRPQINKPATRGNYKEKRGNFNKL